MARRTGGGARRKSIFDPIHGPIVFDGLGLALLAAPEFQRLWGIRQTGFAHLVFPGANHTRLEHSLGTYWVAEQMARRLDLADDDTRRVAAGALLHDVGHGPFSHTLDAPMLEVLGHPHERLSRARIEGSDPDWPAERTELPSILERYGLRPRSVSELVEPGGGRRGPRLLREVLHGAVDADRIDYLQRDAYYTGVAHGAIDATRILDTIRAVDGRVTFAEKGRNALEGFLVGRALMYASVYFHKTVRAAEMMLQAAVERLPGYPASARRIFSMTDGELLVRLGEAGGVSARLADALVYRRLYKRAYGWRSPDRSARAAWRRQLEHPAERRALEDRIAADVRAPPGAVLVDLVGLETRSDPEEEWAGVGLLVGDRVTHPFRDPGPWAVLAHRPPTDWAVSVYAAPRWAGAVGRSLARNRAGLA